MEIEESRVVRPGWKLQWFSGCLLIRAIVTKIEGDTLFVKEVGAGREHQISAARDWGYSVLPDGRIYTGSLA